MEFPENRRSWENQKPPENRQKSGLFWASPFTMHLVCTLLILVRMGPLGWREGFSHKTADFFRVREYGPWLSVQPYQQRNWKQGSASSKPTSEFAQPRLSRVKGRSSPARGYKFGCVCSYMAGVTLVWDDTGDRGTNTHWGHGVGWSVSGLLHGLFWGQGPHGRKQPLKRGPWRRTAIQRLASTWWRLGIGGVWDGHFPESEK